MRRKQQFQKTKYVGVYKIGEGCYQVRVSNGFDELRKRYIQKTFTVHGTAEDAFDFRNLRLKEIKKGPTAAHDWTVSRLMNEYLGHVAGEHTYDSHRTDKSRWAQMEPFIGHRAVAGVSTLELDQVLSALGRQRNIKPQTINRYRSLLSAAFKQAVKWKLLTESPVRDVSTRTAVKYKVKLPSTETIGYLMKAYETSRYPDMGLLMQLTWLNAMRRAEACALRVSDYNPETRVLHIWRQVIVRTRADGGWTLAGLKNKDEREPFAVDNLTHETLVLLMSRRSNADDFLFSDDGGKSPWRPGRVTASQRRIRQHLCPECGQYGKGPLCSKCNVELGIYFRVHDLRGAMTTYLLRKKRSKAAQVRGGWKSEISMRTHYNHSTGEELDEAVMEIDELVNRGA